MTRSKRSNSLSVFAHPPNQPMQGRALDALCTQAEGVIFGQAWPEHARVLATTDEAAAKDRAQIVAWLQQHADCLEPTQWSQLQRLHRLWMALAQPQAAYTLLQKWGESAIQATALADTVFIRIEYLLAKSESLGYIDPQQGRDVLNQAAQHIEALPWVWDAENDVAAKNPAQQYWNEWIRCAEQVYGDWRTAQHGLQRQQAQKESSAHQVDYDPAWDRSKMCLAQAHLARCFAAKRQPALDSNEIAALESSIKENVYAAITHLQQMRYSSTRWFLWSWNAGFSWRWMDLADELLNQQLYPAAVPAAMQALENYWDTVEPQIQEQLAVFIPDPSTLKAMRQSVYTFRAIHQQQRLYRAAAQVKTNDPSASWNTLLQHAQQAYYNVDGGLGGTAHDRLGVDLLRLMEETEQWDEAARIALHAVLNCRKGAAQAAYLLALRRLYDAPSHPVKSRREQLAWPIILLQACRCPLLRDWINKEHHPLPPHDDAYYLQLAHAASPGDLLIDWVQGVYLASQQQWQAALPLLERMVSQRPNWSSCEVLLGLWAARFAVLGVERALQCTWPTAAAGCWNIQLAQQLHYPDRSRWPLPYNKDDSWPLAQLQPLIEHYLNMGIQHFDQFWQRWWEQYIEGKPEATISSATEHNRLHYSSSVHLIDYSDVCLELAQRHIANEDYQQAQLLYQKGIAILYADHFHDHAQGLYKCALGLGEKERAQRIQQILAKLK